MNRALFVVLLGAFDITVMWVLCFSITARLPVVSGLQFKLVEFITCYSNPAADEHPWGNVAFFPSFIHRKITHSFVNAHNAHFILFYFWRSFSTCFFFIYAIKLWSLVDIFIYFGFFFFPKRWKKMKRSLVCLFVHSLDLLSSNFTVLSLSVLFTFCALFLSNFRR